MGNDCVSKLDEACVYADLARLEHWRWLTRPFKLGHQQPLMAQLGASVPTLRKGRGMTFSEVRPYQAGDEVRHIDWKVTARTEKPHTKLFSEEHERPVFFVVEQSENLFFGSERCFKSVLALDLLAILGWATLNQSDRVGGLVFSAEQQHYSEPKRQAPTLLQLLQQALSLHHGLAHPAQRQGHWTGALQNVRQRARPGSKLIIIGDLLALQSEDIALLQQLRAHCDLLALHLQDRLEYTLPSKGDWTFSDGEHQHTLCAEHDQTAYQQRYQQAWLHCQHALHGQRIPLLAFSTDESPLSACIKHGLLRR